MFAALFVMVLLANDPFDWSNVEKLKVGTSIRVTELDGDKWYGRVMQVSTLKLVLEEESGSRSIARSEISLIERFPTSLPKSIPRATVGVGAALSLSSSATPETFQPSVAPAPDTLDQASTPMRDGIYLDALALVGTTAAMVDRAIERTRTTVVVYRARE
jgi:hypothetical protein